MPLSVEAQSLLRKIRAEVDDHWMQGAYGDGQGNYCLTGFLHQFERDPDVRYEATLAIAGAIPHHESIIGWNDRRGRTKEDVKAAIDSALAASVTQGKEEL